MSDQNALAIKPTGAIATALESAGFLAAVTEGKCNLVTPATFLDKPPALHRLAVRAVTIDVDRETYPSPNGKEGEVALGATALQRIGRNAQVNWEDPKRLDDGKEPYLRTYQVGGTIIELDGKRTRLMPGIVTLDYRGEPGWPEEKLGADTRECLRNAPKRTPKRWDIPPGSASSTCKDCGKQAFWVKTPANKNVLVDPDGFCHFDTCSAKAAKSPDGWTEVFQARHFIDRLCVTKAMSACIRKLGIPASLPRERAAKPWVVMAMVQDLDMSDPEQKRAAIAQALGASAALYGPPSEGPIIHEPKNITPEAASDRHPDPRLNPGETVNGDGVIYEAEVITGDQSLSAKAFVEMVDGPEPWDAQSAKRYMLTEDELRALGAGRDAWFRRLNELCQGVYDRFGPDLGADHLAATFPKDWDPSTTPGTLPQTETAKIGAALKALVGR